MAFVIGVDVGGTNTDTAILQGTKVIVKSKTPTTGEKTSGVINSIQTALDGLPADTRSHVLDHLARVSIGTTHFTNAVEKRDRKSLDRVAVIRLCGPASRGLPPFADFPAELEDLVYGGGYMIGGGLEYNTKEISPINPEEVRKTVKEIMNRNPTVRNVVISGVFSPCDERQEKEVERIVKEECPQLSCTLSHEVGNMSFSPIAEF